MTDNRPSLIRLCIQLTSIVLMLAVCTGVNARPTNKQQTHVELATTSWCPYTCFYTSKQFGVVGIYMEKVFASLGIELSIASYPWSRAIRLAKSQQVDGLLTAIPAEAPELIFSSVPISTYQVCFYTLANNSWQYTLPLNFATNQLSVVQDYGYGEPLDSYIKSHNNIVTISGSETTNRLINLLLSKRADIIAVDSLVLDYKSSEGLINTQNIKSAGCLPKNNFYLALTPTTIHKQLLKEIDKALAKPENINYLRQLIAAHTQPKI